jgi:D-tyrosyl-tRNA(Tyr) deacylase
MSEEEEKMKFVIQRVEHAQVEVEGEVIGKIGPGFMVLIGIAETDTEEIADKMIQKMRKLRIFDDENGKTNLSIDDVKGELLLISQFTLYADCKKGNRPSFFRAGNPEKASAMYDDIVEKCRSLGYKTECGKFGAEMKVSLLNDGPFTIVMDSDELLNSKN